MADLERIGLALQGFSAGVGGQLPQFQQALVQREQQQQKLSKERQQALLTDNRVLLDHLKNNRISKARELLINRDAVLGQIDPNADRSDTQGMLQLIDSGNLQLAIDESQVLDTEAVIRGLLDPTEKGLQKIVGGQVITISPEGKAIATDIQGFKLDLREDLELEKLRLLNKKARADLTALAGKPKLDAKDIRAIQKDVSSLIQEPVKVRNSASRLSKLGKTKSATDQLAAIFVFMKSLDPESVVREGEQQQARSTGGITDQMIGFVNQIRGEGALPENVFQQMIATAQTLSNQAITDSRTEVFGFLDTFGDTIPKEFTTKTLARLPALFKIDASAAQQDPAAPPTVQPPGQQPVQQAAPTRLIFNPQTGQLE